MALVTSFERVTLTITGGNSSATSGTLTATDTSKCVPFYTSRVSTLPSSTPYDIPPQFLVELDFLTAPNRVRATTTGSDSSREVVVEISVVEFSSEANVQSGTFTLTANTDTTTTDTLSPTVTYSSGPTKAFAVTSYQGGVVNDNRPSLVRTEITANNTITFTRDSTVASDGITGRYWVVEANASEFSVEQATWQMGIGSTVEPFKDATITTVSNTAKTAVFASIEGDGNALLDVNNQIPVVRLLDDSTVRMQRQASSQTGINCTAFVVQFTGDEKVQRGLKAQAATPPASETVTLDAGTVDSVAMASTVRCGMLTGAASGTSSSDHPDAYIGLDFLTGPARLRIQHLQQDEPGPIDISWEVIEWDVTAAARRVMVVT